ncbi:hypothetical protein RRG08_048935 [Elysia crispata]|uniref:Uncharacterized protein n=1 Tax=Elysia crispata TaxID=231223 RepID=A0AAE0YNU8_9GAST|nr:hypothetical protein RRG08_048935 [Elysia crispata]
MPPTPVSSNSDTDQSGPQISAEETVNVSRSEQKMAAFDDDESYADDNMMDHKTYKQVSMEVRDAAKATAEKVMSRSAEAVRQRRKLSIIY